MIGRALTAAGATLAGILLAGQAMAGPAQPVVIADATDVPVSSVERLEGPGPSSSPELDAPILEDDPRWNCLTMGNRQCGPDYVPLPAELYADVFMPGNDMTDQAPTDCLWAPDETTLIVCTDGTVVTS